MGKSMSTAKQVNRSTVVKVATESTQPKPNQQTICRGTNPSSTLFRTPFQLSKYLDFKNSYTR